MPIIEVTLIEGRKPEQKLRLIEKLTDAAIEAVDAPRETVRVILREVPATHFAVGGKPKGWLRIPSATPTYAPWRTRRSPAMALPAADGAEPIRNCPYCS